MKFPFFERLRLNISSASTEAQIRSGAHVRLQKYNTFPGLTEKQLKREFVTERRTFWSSGCSASESVYCQNRVLRSVRLQYSTQNIKTMEETGRVGSHSRRCNGQNGDRAEGKERCAAARVIRETGKAQKTRMQKRGNSLHLSISPQILKASIRKLRPTKREKVRVSLSYLEKALSQKFANVYIERTHSNRSLRSVDSWCSQRSI